MAETKSESKTEPSLNHHPDSIVPSFTQFYNNDRPITEIIDSYEDSAGTKSERLGLRRFAKACTIRFGGIVSSLTPNDERSSDTLKGSVYGKSNLLGLDYKKIQQIEKNHNEEKLRFISSKNNSIYTIDNDNISNSTVVNRGQRTLRDKKLSLENINKDRRSAIDNKVLNTKKSFDNLKSRVILIKHLPSDASLSSILGQVCGGPLERFVFKTSNDKDNNYIELHFVFVDHAMNFYQYSKCGLFLVNNVHPITEFANRFNSDELEVFHPIISKSLLYHITHDGSRRILIFAKTIYRKGWEFLNDYRFPEPYSHFSFGLDMENIKRDFSVFGEINEVGAVVSRKLCFSLHFTDIRSAINAKRECEIEGTEFNKKYQEWTILYGKDITDRPCYKL
ncbi:uncharacterized protein RJT21DRAFT_132007 [Scheffersomyces amazonensis]|uniref:uncharacterized protein n=1 Tax=Scheffersomyces amazonensis TaxID=1078765 RepID=UPI00315DAA97